MRSSVVFDMAKRKLTKRESKGSEEKEEYSSDYWKDLQILANNLHFAAEDKDWKAADDAAEAISYLVKNPY